MRIDGAGGRCSGDCGGAQRRQLRDGGGDHPGQAGGIQRFERQAKPGRQLIIGGAFVGHDDRQAAGARFGAGDAEGFGRRAVHHHVGAGEDAGKFGAVAHRGDQLDMRIFAHCARHRSAGMAIAQDDQAERPAIAGGGDSGDHHRPLFFRAVPANADQQGGIGRQAALREQAGAQSLIAVAGRKHAGIDAQGIVGHLGEAAIAQAFRQAGRGRNHLIIAAIEPAQIAPEPIEAAIDGVARQQAIEIAIHPGRQGFGVHEQRARCVARPFGHGGGAAPRRRTFDEIRLLFVQDIVNDAIAGEIEIIAVQREARAAQADQAGAAHSAHIILSARHHHGQADAVLLRHLQLAVGIGANAAAIGRIQRGYVDDVHAAGPSISAGAGASHSRLHLPTPLAGQACNFKRRPS